MLFILFHNHTKRMHVFLIRCLSIIVVQVGFISSSCPVPFRKMKDITPLFLILRDWTTAAAWPTSQAPPSRKKKPQFIANCVWVTVLHRRRARCNPVTACSVPRWVQGGSDLPMGRTVWTKCKSERALYWNMHSGEVVTQSTWACKRLIT